MCDIGGTYTTFFMNQQRLSYKGVRFGEIACQGLGSAHPFPMSGNRHRLLWYKKKW
jgi:hypothetical protein